MKKITWFVVLFFGFCVNTQAAFILEVDTDGMDDGVLTFNPGFSFGGDTTTASQSATSSAFGATGGDSIFGGDGSNSPDTYVFNYSPTTTPDNLVIPLGTDLGSGNLASGLVGGGLGTYRIYATWPFTSNVSGGLTRYMISTAGALDVVVNIDQNNKGSDWILLGDIDFTDALSSITVTQSSDINTFVSMRAYGLLFEAVETDGRVPAPATMALFLIGLVGLQAARRKKA